MKRHLSGLLGTLAFCACWNGLVTAEAGPLAETRSHAVTDPAAFAFDALDNDWPAATLYTPDATGEAGGGTDWSYVRFADDKDYLFGYFKTANNGLSLGDQQFWFDMDENQGTGLAPGALPVGADRLMLIFGGSVHLTDQATASLGFLDSQPGEQVAFAAVDGGYGLEFKILRSRLNDDAGLGFDWWANSYLGGAAETYPQGTADANGAHNKYVFATEVPPPPPPPPGSYKYETDPAIAHGPAGGGILGDAALTRLKDGAPDNANWLVAPNQWVGFQDPAFVPANLAGDTGLPQPRVEFSLGSITALDSVDITYLVEDEAKIHAPDAVIVSFSTAGGEFGGDIVSYAFDGADDLAADPVGQGAIRTLHVELGGASADAIRLDFLNDFEWTALGEIKFNAVPEPSSLVLLVLGGALLAWRRWR